ncbi:MAG: fructosamine kinase family protein [Bacteroidota bacterium]
MLPPAITHAIEQTLQSNILSARPVSGGDINESYCVQTKSELLFLKYHRGAFAKSMFEVEAKGLAAIQQSDTIPTPTVIANGATEHFGYLLLTYVPETRPADNFWDRFGHQLARMHQTTAAYYGWEQNNYIGRLAQSNRKESDSWTSFYIEERIRPQLAFAERQQLTDRQLISDMSTLISRLPELLPEEKPALLHGDLWSGNYMVGTNGQALLIDPAVYFGHREMDLAMTQLFGGFPRQFYAAYQECFPLVSGWEERVPIYQLYYLLVHLNLFGVSYLPAVRTAVNRFL